MVRKLTGNWTGITWQLRVNGVRHVWTPGVAVGPPVQWELFFLFGRKQGICKI